MILKRERRCSRGGIVTLKVAEADDVRPTLDNRGTKLSEIATLHFRPATIWLAAGDTR